MINYFEDAVKSICESVRFDSSLAKYSSKFPFGRGAADCLAHFLALAADLGFETHNYDNYIGEAVFGNGQEEFAILAHLDVVPAGDGWTKDPFGGTVENGCIWGRGTVDDKGPAICCLYALKALKDKGFVPSKKIKLIVGCNEENGWGCIEHYNEVASMPKVGFSPDADFPVIYAEKGILQLRLHFPIPQAPFLHLEGGKQANMVCDRCEATPRSLISAKAKEFGLTVQSKKIISYGKSAHGSTPELGINAILPVLRFFEGKNEVVARILDCVFNDVYGLKTLADETGNLTMSPNVIKYRKGQVLVLVDIRYPATVPVEEVLSRVAQFGVKYETVHFQRPLFHGKDSEPVQTLLKTFEECTGKKAEPIAIGGGTYARALECGVGFGPEMPGDEPVVHMADEHISLERVKFLLEIYEKAIERLT